MSTNGRADLLVRPVSASEPDLVRIHHRLLEALGEERPLPELLERACLLLEDWIGGGRCGVLLTRAKPRRLELVASGSFPEGLREELSSIPLDAESSPASAAAERREPFFIENLTRDEAWPLHRDATLLHGLQASWFLPLCSRRDGHKTLGVVAIYFDRPSGETAAQRDLLEMCTQLLAFVIDNTRTRERLERQASYDSLTELPNRRLFQQRLKEAIDEMEDRGSTTHRPSRDTRFAVIVLDVDDFKNVNDTLGYHMGDHLLQAVGQRLEGCVRRHDTVARSAGDQFLLLIRGIRRDEDISAIAKKIKLRVNEPYDFGGHGLFVTVSLGVSVYPWDGQDAQTLLRNAETALFDAKERGGSAFQLFRPEMVRKKPTVDNWFRDSSLRKELREVIDNDQLELFYQLKVKADGKKICGSEALARWRHPAQGIILPTKFIPMAEQTGLILSIGEWALFEACRQNKKWQESGFPDMTVSVNISSQQFRHTNLVQTILRALDETGLRPGGLELEITESLVMDDVHGNLLTLREIHDLGVRIAIDDFGTGFSSLSYLKKFPVHTLKIDRSFIQDIGHNADGEMIIQAILSLADALNLEVVAEGVETAEQFDFLVEQGCDVIQGFFKFEPLPVPQVTQLLISRS